MKKLAAPFSVVTIASISALVAFLFPYYACYNGLNSNCGNGKKDTLSHMSRDGITMRLFTVSVTILAACMYKMQREVHRWGCQNYVTNIDRGLWWERSLHYSIILVSPILTIVFLMCPIDAVSTAVHTGIAIAMATFAVCVTNGLLLTLYYRKIAKVGIWAIRAVVVGSILSIFMVVILALNCCRNELKLWYAALESIIGLIFVYANIHMYVAVRAKSHHKTEVDDGIVTYQSLTPAADISNTRRFTIKL